MDLSLSLDESRLRILRITHIPTFRSESTVTAGVRAFDNACRGTIKMEYQALIKVHLLA